MTRTAISSTHPGVNQRTKRILGFVAVGEEGGAVSAADQGRSSCSKLFVPVQAWIPINLAGAKPEGDVEAT